MQPTSTLYTLTITRKNRFAFWGSAVEIYIDGHYRGRVRNGNERRFQLTKNEISLYVRDAGGINIIPVTSHPINIIAEEAKEFQYQVEYGMSDVAFVSALIILIAGIVAGIYYMKIFLCLSILSIFYFIGNRFLNKDHYLFIEKVMRSC